MGFLQGLVGVVTSPITLVGKTINHVVDGDLEIEDILTLGATKIVKAAKDTAEEIENDFK